MQQRKKDYTFAVEWLIQEMKKIGGSPLRKKCRVAAGKKISL